MCSSPCWSFTRPGGGWGLSWWSCRSIRILEAKNTKLLCQTIFFWSEHLRNTALSTQVLVEPFRFCFHVEVDVPGQAWNKRWFDVLFSINASKSFKSLIVNFLWRHAVWILEINSGFKNESAAVNEATHAIDFAREWCRFTASGRWHLGGSLVCFWYCWGANGECDKCSGGGGAGSVMIWSDLPEVLIFFTAYFDEREAVLGLVLLDCCDVVLFWRVANNNKTEEALKLSFCISFFQDIYIIQDEVWCNANWFKNNVVQES